MRDAAEGQPFAARLRAEGRDEVARMYREIFPDLRVQIGPTPPDSPMLLEQTIYGDTRIAYQRTRLHGRVVSTGNLGDMQMVGLLRSGSIGVTARRTSWNSSRPFLFPEGDFTGDAEQYELELLTVPNAEIARAARALGASAATRVRFTGIAPVTAAAERFWRSTHSHVSAILTDRETLAAPLLRQEAFRSTVRAMLLTFPNTAMAADVPAAPATGNDTVDNAASYIETNADRPIDLIDIAAAVGTAPAALTRAFRTRHAQTPLQYLRQVRMRRAQADLAVSDPWGTATVRDIAARWGFLHPGRFAKEYQDRFNEPPSTTLHR